MSRLLPLALLAGLGLLAGACGEGEAEGGGDGGDGGDGVRGSVQVFAASSLTDAFTELGEAFEAEHAGVEVDLNFASSSALATQIEEGAPADVFASANEAQMQRLVDDGLIDGKPATFVQNRLVIVAPSENPAGIRSAADLAEEGVRLVLAAQDAPVGAYAREAIRRLAEQPDYPERYTDAVLANVVSNEANVRAVLAKVELGEADAGIVYRTDAGVAGDGVEVIEIPEIANVVATYPIAVTSDAEQREAARAFVDFVLGVKGQAILAEYGFDPA